MPRTSCENNGRITCVVYEGAVAQLYQEFDASTRPGEAWSRLCAFEGLCAELRSNGSKLDDGCPGSLPVVKKIAEEFVGGKK